MASFPVPGAPGGRLDGPPPTPGVPQPSFASLVGPGGGPPPESALAEATPNVPQEAVSGVMKMGQAIDQAILALATSVPAGSREFSQARDLLKRGLAKFLASAASPGGPPSMTGTGFPGGIETGP